jgi:hypothetical protein
VISSKVPLQLDLNKVVLLPPELYTLPELCLLSSASMAFLLMCSCFSEVHRSGVLRDFLQFDVNLMSLDSGAVEMSGNSVL